jgi:outer membrane protein OmpA-like peptidoglycan-associated protein
MSRIPLTVSVGALLALVCAPAGASAAPRPAQVRVVNAPAPVLRWFNATSEVVTELERGDTLDVLDEDSGWFWVVLPPDAHGTRRPGWIRVTDVEPVAPPPAAPSTPVSSPPVEDKAAEAATPPAPPADDKVSISVRRGDGEAAPGGAAATGVRRFEDIHFDRDRDTLRPEDMDGLRSAVAALKADPSLTVNIEGYTCNLGSEMYNLALGARRANAVKTFLVGEGVPADRLHAVSMGEKNAQYDNSREETRRLNRRVALVPGDN